MYWNCYVWILIHLLNWLIETWDVLKLHGRKIAFGKKSRLIETWDVLKL